MKTSYSSDFFANIKDLSHLSARRVLPIVQQMVDFSSVVDVGCGTGTWLAACRELGISDLLGVDGSYVDVSALMIDVRAFVAHDLTTKLNVNKRYDLAICLEVAEHLPQSAADILIRSLCSLSDAVLFSAAVPGQGGVNHINEQWPTYWAEKFKAHGLRMIDCIREQIWDDKFVEPWYRQNMFLCLRFPERYSQLSGYLDRPLLRLIHPDYSPKPTIMESLELLKRAVRRRLVREAERFHVGSAASVRQSDNVPRNTCDLL